MSEWTQSSLAEIAELRFGRTPPRSEARFWNPSRGYPWATIADMRADPVLETAETVSEAGLPYSGHSVSAGSILMSFKLTVGRVARAGTELLTNEAIVSVHGLDGKADDRWLYHALPSIARGGITDTAVKGSTLNKAKLEKLIVHLPPLDEQQRIAEILDAIDETIQINERVIAKSEAICEGLKWELIGRRSADDEGWKQATIRDLGSVVTGSTPDTSDERYWDGIVPFVTPGDMGSSGEIGDTDRHVTPLGANRMKMVPPGSVAVVCIGSTIGKVARVRKTCVTNQQINSIIPSATYDGEFVACVLELANAQIQSVAGRQAIPIINANALRSLQVYVCSVELQRQITARIAASRNHIETQRFGLKKLEQLRTGLASDLLSGRIRTVAE